LSCIDMNKSSGSLNRSANKTPTSGQKQTPKSSSVNRGRNDAKNSPTTTAQSKYHRKCCGERSDDLAITSPLDSLSTTYRSTYYNGRKSMIKSSPTTKRLIATDPLPKRSTKIATTYQSPYGQRRSISPGINKLAAISSPELHAAKQLNCSLNDSCDYFESVVTSSLESLIRADFEPIIEESEDGESVCSGHGTGDVNKAENIGEMLSSTINSDRTSVVDDHSRLFETSEFPSKFLSGVMKSMKLDFSAEDNDPSRPTCTSSPRPSVSQTDEEEAESGDGSEQHTAECKELSTSEVNENAATFHSNGDRDAADQSDEMTFRAMSDKRGKHLSDCDASAALDEETHNLEDMDISNDCNQNGNESLIERIESAQDDIMDGINACDALIGLLLRFKSVNFDD